MATREVEHYLIEPSLWTLHWVCSFCQAHHLWERGIPNDQEVRDSRARVAQATATHLHCAPGCGRWISGGAVFWRWEHHGGQD